MNEVRLICCPSSASATEEARGNVVISGSYGGEYNAFHAAKWGIRGVVLNDAGVGKNNAGINGLAYLDRIGLAAATASADTCHIGDGEHMLHHGVISHVNKAATRLGCRIGQSVRDCADLMRAGPVVSESPPEISGGKRYTISDAPGERRVICIDAAPMLEEGDAGAIAITGSHAALFRGKPDGLIAPDVYAVFFSDAGVGLDQAGIQRLALLDDRKLIAAAASADSASIGNSRDILRTGVISFANKAASAMGAKPGMPVRVFVDILRTGS
jgi:hypothetical protein